MDEEKIQIASYEEQNENYKIYPNLEINGKYFDFNYEHGLSLSNNYEKDGYTLIILHQTEVVDKSINYKKLIVKIIKWCSEDKLLKQDIEITQNKTFPLKEFNPNFLYFDMFKVDDKMSFLSIFLFNHLYFFKIYEKEDNNEISLYYQELKLNLSNNINKTNTLLFVGNCLYNNNKLEYVFLEKPKNYFLYYKFDLSSLDIESDEIECKINYRTLDEIFLDKYKLKKFWRGLNIDQFVFIENKEFKMIIKDNNDKSKMLIYPFVINYKKNNILPDKVPFLIKILEKTYIIIDVSKFSEKSNNDKNHIILAIFEIIFNQTENKFDVKLLQEIDIKINSKDGNYNLTRISENKIMIVDDDTIFFVILNNNCMVESVYLFNKIHQKKYYINNDENFFRIYIISPKEYSISCVKISCKKEEDNSVLLFENSFNINLNDYELFIDSTIANKINNLKIPNKESFYKSFNKLKDKLKNEKIESEKGEKRVEKLSVSIVETLEDIPDEKKLLPTNKIQNFQNNCNNNEQNKNNKWSNENQIKYNNNKTNNYYNYYNNKSKMNNQLNNTMNLNMGKNFYNFKNNYSNNNNNNNNNQINNMKNYNSSFNVNHMNNINLIQQMTKLSPMNQYQLNKLNTMNNINNINNIHNQNNNINLMNNSMNNNMNTNPQIYKNVGCLISKIN